MAARSLGTDYGRRDATGAASSHLVPEATDLLALHRATNSRRSRCTGRLTGDNRPVFWVGGLQEQLPHPRVASSSWVGFRSPYEYQACSVSRELDVGFRHDEGVSSATLRLTRSHSRWGDRVRRYVILVDDLQIGEISDGETKTIDIEPGHHTLRLKIDWTGSEDVLFDVGDGQSVNFRCGPRVKAAFAVVGLLQSVVQRDKWILLERI